jgi:dTDP-4-amino-4,6-dideoxygalactose transaminase
MIYQKQYSRQYKLLQKEYDDVYKDIMEKGYDSNGPYSEKVQEKLKKITGRKHVFMTISGTSAITAAIYALDLFEKTVAVGSFNYSACVNQYQAFSKPLFVDCDENTMIDMKQMPKDCDALMLVNYWGHLADYDSVPAEFKGKVITDCSQSIGARYKGRPDGFFGDVSTFAFGGQKPIGTRGVTGAIATDDDAIAHRIDCAINQGKSGERRDIKSEMIGFRGAPQEIQCGMIHVGLRYYEKWQQKRKNIATRIFNECHQYPIRFIRNNEYCESSFYKLPFEIDNRDDFLKFMRFEGIDCQVPYIDDWNEIFGDGRSMPMTRRMINSTATLPLSPFFTDNEVEKIIDSVKKYFRHG